MNIIFFQEYIAASSTSITDINTDEIILDGEQNVTYEVTGFGTITSVILTDGTYSTTCTDITEDP